MCYSSIPSASQNLKPHVKPPSCPCSSSGAVPLPGFLWDPVLGISSHGLMPLERFGCCACSVTSKRTSCFFGNLLPPFTEKLPQDSTPFYPTPTPTPAPHSTLQGACGQVPASSLHSCPGQPPSGGESPEKWFPPTHPGEPSRDQRLLQLRLSPPPGDSRCWRLARASRNCPVRLEWPSTPGSRPQSGRPTSKPRASRCPRPQVPGSSLSCPLHGVLLTRPQAAFALTPSRPVRKR